MAGKLQEHHFSTFVAPAQASPQGRIRRKDREQKARGQLAAPSLGFGELQVEQVCGLGSSRGPVGSERVRGRRRTGRRGGQLRHPAEPGSAEASWAGWLL